MSLRFRLLTLVLLLSSILPAIVLADSADDDYQKGLAFYQQKQYDQAILYLKEATSLNPDSWQAYQALGNADYMSGDKKGALDAFDKSLEINSNNPQLKSFADKVAAQIDTESAQGTAPPAGSYPAVSSPSTHSPSFRGPYVFRKGGWAYVQAGVINSTLGDLSTGVQGIQNAPGVTNASASNSSTGFLLGGEAGYSFDEENALGLSANIGFFGGYTDRYTFGGNDFNDSFSPVMIAIEPLYHHFILMGDSRLNLEIGPGFYITGMNVTEVVNGTLAVNGPMDGYGFGGVVGGSYDISFKNFSIDIFAHGRLATTSNIQGTFTDDLGNSYQLGLATGSNGVVGPLETDLIGTGGTRWSNVDYTGFDAGLAVTYRYW